MTFKLSVANQELLKDSTVIVHSLASQTKGDTSKAVNLEELMSVENFGSRRLLY